jgi:HAE1 family hydrophobic/amphiphilic exporter-1
MARFFIYRPILAMVIALITVIGSLVAMRGLPVAQFPDIVPPQIIVSATYTGADAVTIEQSVATPLEQQMNGVDNMLYIQSTNANDGTAQVTVTFDVETDVNIDQVNVQNRVAQAQPNLPTDVNQYGISTRKSTGLPMLLISFVSPNQSYDALFLANYANININDVLYRVPGVGEVRLFGASDYAMRIWVKPDVLAKLGLAVPDLVGAVLQQSSVNPTGRVGAAPAPPGIEMTYTVRAQGRLQTPEEFGQVVVRSDPGGAVVRLQDVARIELGALNYQQTSRTNGQPSTVIAIFQAPGSNALAVADGVKKTMQELRERFPADLDYTITLDTTLPVTEGIREIVKTLFEAMILVLLVVFLFLQNWRATLIPLIAVPVSLIGTFAVFPRQLLRTEQQRHDGAAVGTGDDAPHQRSGIHQPLQSLPCRASHRRGCARVQFRSSHGGARSRSKGSTPAGDGLRMGRSFVPGKAGFRGCRHLVRTVAGLRVSHPCGAL